MHSQRRTVTLLRWVMFLALAYLLWASAEGSPMLQLGLLAVVAATNIGLGRLPARWWEHPALLPVVAALDIGVLTASVLWAQGFDPQFFFAYFVLLAAVAILPSLRLATLATSLIVLAYGGLLSLQQGWALVQTPELLGRLGFLFSVGVGYGGLMEAGKARLQEAALQGQLVGWATKLSDAFSEDFDSFDVIHQVLTDVQDVYPVAVRVSLVQITRDSIQVVSSSDDPDVRQLDLDPERYPELREVVESGEPRVIGDIRARAEQDGLLDLVNDLEFNALLLCPVDLGNLGHVVLRVACGDGHFTDRAIRTTQDVAHAIGVVFRQAKIRETLERSERMEMISQITTSVSHSFNGILSTVLLSTEALRRGLEEGDSEGAEVDGRFETIDLAVKEGLTIVERLAAWTRLDQRGTDDQDPRSAVIEPQKLLEDAWKYARPHWLRREATRDLQLRLDIDTTRNIRGHRAELREALLNLMINAIDAMPRGGVMTLGIEEADDEIRFTVADTGTGMTEEELGRAFEPLYTTKGTGGTGLGLTIARSVATRHGGELTAESARGVGSEFHLVLAASDAEAPRESQREAVAADSNARDRLLLVDANELVRDVMVRFLQTLDKDVDTVDSTEEAEVMIRAGRDYSGLLVDAESASEPADFLDSIEAAYPGLCSQTLFYSTQALPPELHELESRYGFGFVDRSAGLAALTDALEEQLRGPAEPIDPTGENGSQHEAA